MVEGVKNEGKLKEYVGFALLFLILLIAGIILINDKENPVKDNASNYSSNEGEKSSGVDSSQQASNSSSPASTETKPAKVNINTASIEDLDTLPGIGEITAQKIIDYRTKSGPFKSTEAIMDVSGIGEAKYSKIKELITI